MCCRPLGFVESRIQPSLLMPEPAPFAARKIASGYFKEVSTAVNIKVRGDPLEPVDSDLNSVGFFKRSLIPKYSFTGIENTISCTPRVPKLVCECLYGTFKVKVAASPVIDCSQAVPHSKLFIEFSLNGCYREVGYKSDGSRGHGHPLEALVSLDLLPCLHSLLQLY